MLRPPSKKQSIQEIQLAYLSNQSYFEVCGVDNLANEIYIFEMFYTVRRNLL